MTATGLRAPLAPPAGSPAAAPAPAAALAWLALLAAAGLLLFARGLAIGYFGDDFDLVRVGPPRPLADHLLHAARGTGMYRPVDGLLLEVIQSRFGLLTWPIHLTGVVAHVLLAWLVWAAALALGLPAAAARLASLGFLASQASVAAVLGNDTLSQVFAALCGCAALSLLWLGLRRAGEERPHAALALRAASVVLMTLAFFSKEAGLGYLPGALVLLAVHHRGVERRGWIARALRDVLPYVAVAVTYLLLRRMAAGTPAELGAGGYYGFRLGTNVPVNLAMLLGAAALPLSSVRAFDLWAAGQRMALAGVGALVLACAAVALYGAARSPWRRPLAVVAALGVLALSPMLPLNHVSELYAYNALAFVALVGGAGAVAALRAFRGPWHAAGWIAVAALLAFQAAGVVEKAALMDRNGRAAARMLDDVLAAMPSVPPGATLWLVRAADAPAGYSVFRVAGVDLLRHGDIFIRERSGRADAQVRMVDERDARETMGPGDVALIARGDRLERF